MTQRNSLYRRPSGIYVLRITIPTKYRDHVGQSEIHASTLCRDLHDAKAVASRLLNLWTSSLRVWAMSENRTDAAGMSTARKTLTSISEISSASGLPVEQLLREVLSRNVPLVYEANSEPGYLVPDIAKIDRECPEIGGFVLNSAIEIGTPHAFNRPLKVFNPRSTILSIIEKGFSEEVVFRIMRKKSEAAFFDLPGIRLTAQNVLILKIHAELLSIIPSTKAATHPGPSSGSRPVKATVPNEEVYMPPTHHVVPAYSKHACECCKPNRAEEPTSAVLKAFLTRK